ncbi:MAG: T9SS type A sorting domain-containing protein [Saprospiraceae bacterium]|nr:T9SS type A sorting domain-containing protein [Saprospiraceae bacterium]
MKHFVTGLGLLLAIGVYAQPSILLVDDSKDNFNNTGFLALALDSAGYEYTLFDAAGDDVSPTGEELSQYDLVIWHTSTDGVDLQLWGADDIDNGNLLSYLQEGGNLWLIGNDFMYDRYGAAPDTFQLGEFPYDYLGIDRYIAQAYGDDGGLGVPGVEPAPGQPAGGLGALNWTFSTLWWADAVSPLQTAAPVYLMSGDAYPLAGMPAAVWYNQGDFRVMSFFFDLTLVSDFQLAKQTVASVVGLFESLVSDTETPPLPGIAMQVTPNPFAESVKLSLSLERNAMTSIQVVDLFGRKIAQPLNRTELIAGQHDFQWIPSADLPNGVYLARFEIDGKSAAEYLVLSK